MGFLWLAALVLVVIGFSVVALAGRAGNGVRFGPLRSREIDPRSWGIDVMSAGTMLSLALWALAGVAWPRQPVSNRVALVAGGAWAVLCLVRAAVPLMRRGRPSSPVLPVPGKGSRPPWLFLLLGWAIAIRLVWSVFHRMG
jgi:hypothetical protein